MSFKEDTIRFNSMDKNRVKCSCSHTIIMTKADRTICSYCGKWVYRKPEIKFRYQFKQALIKL